MEAGSTLIPPRGLGEGVKDNKITASNFFLLLKLARLSQMRLMHSLANLLLRQRSESKDFRPFCSIEKDTTVDILSFNETNVLSRKEKWVTCVCVKEKVRSTYVILDFTWENIP